MKQKYCKFGWNKSLVALGVCLALWMWGGVLFPASAQSKKSYYSADLQKRAERGEASAQYTLGWCYFNGDGVQRNYNEAAKWYRKAAEQGNARGQSNLGYCYYKGLGVSQGYGEAFKWYRKSAEQGDAVAQSSLAICYYTGNGVTKNHQEAKKWWHRAAAQGDPGAIKYLKTYFNEQAVPATTSTAKSVNPTPKATTTPRTSVQSKTQSTPSTPVQSKAQSQSSTSVQPRPNNSSTSKQEDYMTILKRKAANGDANSQEELGLFYCMGIGVNYNLDEGKRWLQKAARQGNKDAVQFIESLNDIEELIDTVGFAPLIEMANEGDADTQVILSFCYYTSIGTTRNPTEGKRWLQKAARQGSKEAIELLDAINMAEKRFEKK